MSMGVISNGSRDVKGADTLKNNFMKIFFFAVSSTAPVPYYDNEGKLQNNVTM